QLPAPAHGGYARMMGRAFAFAANNARLRTVIILGAVVNGLAFSAIILTQPFLEGHDVPVGAFGFILAPLQVGAVAAALLAHRAVGAVGEKLAVAGICAVARDSLAVLGQSDAV